MIGKRENGAKGDGVRKQHIWREDQGGYLKAICEESGWSSCRVIYDRLQSLEVEKVIYLFVYMQIYQY